MTLCAFYLYQRDYMLKSKLLFTQSLHTFSLLLLLSTAASLAACLSNHNKGIWSRTSMVCFSMTISIKAALTDSRLAQIEGHTHFLCCSLVSLLILSSKRLDACVYLNILQLGICTCRSSLFLFEYIL